MPLTLVPRQIRPTWSSIARFQTLLCHSELYGCLVYRYSPTSCLLLKPSRDPTILFVLSRTGMATPEARQVTYTDEEAWRLRATGGLSLQLLAAAAVRFQTIVAAVV